MTGSALPCWQQSNFGFWVFNHHHAQTKMIWETVRGILTLAYRTPPCPRAGLSPSMNFLPIYPDYLL
jgi:hypothetical protein